MFGLSGTLRGVLWPPIRPTSPQSFDGLAATPAELLHAWAEWPADVPLAWTMASLGAVTLVAALFVAASGALIRLYRGEWCHMPG